jgi:hypothetical protein
MDDRERLARARSAVRRQAFRRMVDLGLTQGELADRAEISYRTVNRFFNEGWREPVVIAQISQALEWPPDEIERRVDAELARQELHELETRVPGTLILSLEEGSLEGLSGDELTELRAMLHGLALRMIGEIKTRTPPGGRSVTPARGLSLASMGA